MSLNLISKDSFKGFLNIAFSQSPDVDDFTSYADQVEQTILTAAFGSDMYNDMVEIPTDPIYTRLVTDYSLDIMLEYFFYFYYLRDRESYDTTLGEFESLPENATKSEPGKLNLKLTNVYNNALELYYNVCQYVYDNKDIYTYYTETQYKRQTNVFGIVTDFNQEFPIPENLFLTGLCRNNLNRY